MTNKKPTRKAGARKPARKTALLKTAKTTKPAAKIARSKIFPVKAKKRSHKRRPWWSKELHKELRAKVGLNGILLAIVVAVVGVIGGQYIINHLNAAPLNVDNQNLSDSSNVTVGAVVGEAQGFRAFDVLNRSGVGSQNSPYVDAEGQSTFQVIAGGAGVMAIYNTTDGQHELLSRTVAKTATAEKTYSALLKAPHGAKTYRITAEFYKLNGKPSGAPRPDGLIDVPANSPLIGSLVDTRSLEITYDPSAKFLGLQWWWWIIGALILIIAVMLVHHTVKDHQLRKAAKAANSSTGWPR
ncbi:MAG: hypothetical protein LBM73_00600 [Candidatus Nomurabacteria bacterium]|jgi:uncharacterized membrane protein YeaQ/YmgE (transglycosylase-associated protein family)|nr:hypothetical protein [Candidatus Nomurabacteria bacterium]